MEPTQIIEEKFEVHKIVLPERTLEKNCAQIEVPRERVPQLTAEQISEVLQFREETVDDAEQIGEVPQIREETIEIVINTVQEWISETKISRQGSV